MKLKISSFFKKNTNSIILSLYLGSIINIQLFTIIPINFFTSPIAKISFFIITLLIFLLFYFISSFIIKRISKIKFKFHCPPSYKNQYKLFLIFLLVSLIISFTWFIAYSPGGFTPDSIDQYGQAISNNYSDWHPTLHTLLFFKLPMTLFNNASAIVICQIILFSLAVSYALTTIHKIAGKKWSITSAILILANPMVIDELMSPWKDVAFGIFALFITTITLKIYFSNGAWGNKNSKIILLAIIISCATIFRHNAILFTLPLVISLFFFIKQSQWIKLSLLIIVIIFTIKIPLYSALQVSSPSNRTSETTGLLLTIIGSSIKQTPEALDNSITDFAYEIAPQEKWENQYVTGDFNSIKWQSNLSPIETAGIPKIASLTTKALLQSPAASLNGLFKATQVVYNLEKTDIAYSITPGLSDNDYGIARSGNKTIQSAIDLYRKFFNNSILHYFTLIGTTIIIMIIFILGRNHWRNKEWQKILLCSPILFYDFGTMFFLTSPETRFFYINFLIYPVIVLLATITTKPRLKQKNHRQFKNAS